ncbi:MAG TPA: hypothetical protein VFQ35_24450 [Polyangiaceae bacterium]|nr:hypothetical protein [Polyangiaceae bacterium]
MKVRSLAPAFAALLAATAAHAEPEWNVGVTAAGCLVGDHPKLFEYAAFCGSVGGDVLFLRESTKDFGIGPYASLGTAAFSDLRVSAGARALFPIAEDFPLVASLGGVLRDGRDPGIEGSLFWGLRSFNFHGSYNIAVGLVLTGTHLFEGPRSNALALGAQVDGAILALPFLLAMGALK